ncbi:MAG: DUF1995 family protein [Thermosynechococcaceae cyanobacterium]
MTLPDTLDAAIAQSVEATRSALADGRRRLQIEFLFPELKPMPVAQQYLNLFPELGGQFKVFFADAGAAALARRDWGEMPSCIIRGVNELLEPVQPEDEAFVFIAPTPVEVNVVEKICGMAGDRPCILLNPQLQDVSIVGIGYTARQLRERFLSTIETCYFLRPLEKGAVFRSYPGSWQVWWDNADVAYQLIAEEPDLPQGERLEQILAQVLPVQAKKGGLLQEMQQFLKALTQ